MVRACAECVLVNICMCTSMAGGVGVRVGGGGASSASARAWEPGHGLGRVACILGYVAGGSNTLRHTNHPTAKPPSPLLALRTCHATARAWTPGSQPPSPSACCCHLGHHPWHLERHLPWLVTASLNHLIVMMRCRVARTRRLPALGPGAVMGASALMLHCSSVHQCVPQLHLTRGSLLPCIWDSATPAPAQALLCQRACQIWI